MTDQGRPTPRQLPCACSRTCWFIQAHTPACLHTVHWCTCARTCTSMFVLCVYIFIHVHMYVYIYIYICIYIYTCMKYVNICICTCTFICVYTDACKYAHVNIHDCTSMHVHVHVHVCLRTCSGYIYVCTRSCIYALSICDGTDSCSANAADIARRMQCYFMFLARAHTNWMYTTDARTSACSSGVCLFLLMMNGSAPPSSSLITHSCSHAECHSLARWPHVRARLPGIQTMYE
jgi:hypothetical protein